jgi:hypothetical protein
MPRVSRDGDGRKGRRQARQFSTNLRRASEKQAEKATSFTEQYRRWQRRRFLSGGLIALGVVVVFTHVVVHLGNIEWLPTTGMQDLLTGYPMGAALIVIGLSLLPRS